MTNEPEASGPTFDIPGDRQYSMIRDVPWGQSVDYYAEVIASFALFAEQRDKGFNGTGPQQQAPASQQQQRAAPAQGRSGRGKGETRADRYPVLAGEQCDECQGPVGRYPQTGQMTSDKAVCLGRCKDGRFIHTVRWLDDEDGGGHDGPAPEEPF